MKHVTIFRDQRIYASHASACAAENGDILVAFRQAPFEHIFAHVHPESSIGLVRSSDGGDTWDPATRITVMDPGEEMNVNDPSLTTLRDGTIILTAFAMPAPRLGNKARWGERARAVRGNDYFYVPGVEQIFVCRSFDHGLTWEEPAVVDTSCYGGGGGVFASVVELSDGRLLMPITNYSQDTGEHTAYLIGSDDKGKSWGPHLKIVSWTGSGSGEHSFGLPSVIAYDDEHLLAAGWTVVESGTLLTSSEDGGMSWSPLQPLHTRGSCMHLLETNRGTTILSYGFRNPPYGIRLWPSFDSGKTWDPKHTAALRSDGAMRDLGYPWTIQLKDGRLFCVYYFNIHDEDRSYYDEKKSLELCEEWKLDPPLYTYQTAGLRFIGGTLLTEEELLELGGTASIEEPDATGPTLI